MRTNLIIAMAILAVFATLFSCKNNSSGPAAKGNITASPSKQTPKGKYSIKSGIVEYKTRMMGMDMKQTLAFDDYGKEELTEVIVEMMGAEVHTFSLSRDGFIYRYDLMKKTGTKRPLSQGRDLNIDFENLSGQMARDMNLKKEGSEEFLGRSCEKMSIDYTKMQMKGTYLLYKGVALKVDSDLGSVKMNLVAGKFLENPEIPAAKFEVPADIKIVESK